MRVMIADDQPEVCLAIKILLEHESKFRIVGEVDRLGILLEKIKDFQPDLILLDWELSNSGVPDIIKDIRSQYPKLKIIALSGRPEAARAALSTGVDAFVSKGENSDKLLDAISRILVLCQL